MQKYLIRHPKSFYDILCQMEPFGPDNLRPIFMAKNVFNTGWSQGGKRSTSEFSVATKRSKN